MASQQDYLKRKKRKEIKKKKSRKSKPEAIPITPAGEGKITQHRFGLTDTSDLLASNSQKI